MKYALIVSLILWQAWTSLKLIECRHGLIHLDLIHSATIRECGELWLNMKDASQGLH